MGLLGKLKGALGGKQQATASDDTKLFEATIDKTHKELKQARKQMWRYYTRETDVYINDVSHWPDKQKLAFILYLIPKMYNLKNRDALAWDDPAPEKDGVCDGFVEFLVKDGLTLDDEETATLINAFVTQKRFAWTLISSWPVAALVSKIDRTYKKGNVPAVLVQALENMRASLTSPEDTHHNSKEKVKLLEKIDDIIFRNSGETIKPTLFLGDDGFSAYANNSIAALPNDEKPHWYLLIQAAQKASGAKPSAKYLDSCKKQFKELGVERFKKTVNDWFTFILQLKEKEINYPNGYIEFVLLSAVNSEAVKGFVWMCSHFHDAQTLDNIAKLAERCFKKVPGKGPAAAAVGNACIYTLYKSKGLDGVGHLSRLKLRIKQNNTQKLIEKYLHMAAEEQGVSIYEIEDIAVDDYKLVDGQAEWDFDGYKAVVRIVAVGKTETKWYKPDGNEQKAAPSIIKEKQAAKLKKLTATTKAIEATLTAQRDRIDRLLRIDRQMNWEHFNTYYFNHGLMGFLTKKIIWNFKEGKAVTPVIYLDGAWVDSAGNTITPTGETVVSLWHPATATVDEVKTWREFLIENTIQQPIKQAFREVYLLTEAELNTRSYSNRMAAHILRQHQFNSLAKTRGWRYALMGNWDGGGSHGADIELPEYNLHAEYWVNEVNANDQYNDTGIWNYVANDQVRFISTTTSELVDLINVPPVIFSEVMRDVDLFVGVASVGNDPTWSDTGGLPTYRDYWQSYSFGDLTEIAKSRKELLTRLLPRLKISKIAEIRDKFLVVKGKLRTYKIHIGSTNILMEPNDQYLCIVPDRSKNTTSENLFLPFEGDAGLSIILSKAFLLADDDKITDSTITSQINRQ